MDAQEFCVVSKDKRTRRAVVEWEAMSETLCTPCTLSIYVSGTEFPDVVLSRFLGETE